jgi:CheY-like chemotaxis protein
MPSNEQAQRAGEIRSGGARILVVEDNALNRLLLHDILELRGHVIIEAANVGEALPLLDDPHLDLLLLDVHIPGGGGEAMIKEVRKRAALADLPIVAVTSLAMPGDRERLLSSGFQGYLSKPIDTRTFGPTVEAFLRPNAGRGSVAVGAAAPAVAVADAPPQEIRRVG